MMTSRRSLLAGIGAFGLTFGSAARGVWAEPRPRPRPAQLAAPATTARADDVETLITGAHLGADVSYAVIDIATGTVMESRGAEIAMAPASTLKSVTSLFALDRLGANHRFATRIILAGDTLVLAGGGDPLLDSDDLDALAGQVAKALAGAPMPKRLAVWGGALPRIDQISSGQDDYLAYNPTISGIILNFNRVHVDWRLEKSEAQFSMQARGRKRSPVSNVITIAARDPRLPLFAHSVNEAGEAWTVARGALGRSGARWLPVRRPEIYAGDVFRTLCAAAGVTLPAPEVIDTLPEGQEIARHESPPLAEILHGMMKYSTNVTAEVVGLAASGAADLDASAGVMGAWLGGQLGAQNGGGAAPGYAFHDHSGLSPRNRIDAATLAQMIAGPGTRGNLRALMKPVAMGEPKKPSDVTVVAKTGTLNFVSNLAGYAEGPGGRELAFAILTGDEQRRQETEGMELPAGMRTWLGRSKALQKRLITIWVARYGLQAPRAMIPAMAAKAQAGAAP